MGDCILARWQPVIGDPSWQGWATVLVYLATAALAFLASRAAFPQPTARQERVFWVLVLLLLTGLAVNKQLDLQSALTAAGRCLARAQGWYGQRRLVQMGFLLGLALLATAVAGCNSGDGSVDSGTTPTRPATTVGTGGPATTAPDGTSGTTTATSTVVVYFTRGEKIVKVTSPIDHDVTRGHLCIKGRFGWEFVNLKRE